MLSSPRPTPADAPKRVHAANALSAFWHGPMPARRVIVWLSLYLLVAANWPLWFNLASIGRAPSVYLFSIVAMGWLVLAATVALLILTAWSRWFKPLWMLVVLVAAVVQHYMFAYRMVMDPSMVANVLQTDPNEARDLVTGGMLADVALVWLPAVAWLWSVRIRPEPWWSKIWRNLAICALAIVLAVVGLLATARQVMPLMRAQPHLRYMMNPVATLYSAGTFALRPMFQRRRDFVRISADAALGKSHSASGKPPLLILVVGETARGDHFSLNGYSRDTNPGLAARNVASFRNVRSCGTNTIASVPCMFSHLGRREFESRRHEYENLLDVLQAAGLAVLWLDNQSGCKGVCARVPSSQTNDAVHIAKYPALCSGDECLDAVLLEDLDARIAALPPERRAKGVVVVLHQIGSHGPAYHRRSSEAHKRFMPECRIATLAECSHSELINAYDNSIAYTDHVLAGTIDWLKLRAGRYDGGLLYMSDHGESLGEYGLYLHGVPYDFAPEAQKHVAFVAWLDGGLGARSQVSKDCLQARSDVPLTHDNFYHTVLGVMDVRSQTYAVGLDAFAMCRGGS